MQPEQLRRYYGIKEKIMKPELNGVVRGVYLSPSLDDLQSVAQAELEISMDGIPGDRHFGATLKSNSRSKQYPRGVEIRNSRQVSLLSAEELEEMARRLNIPEVKTEWLGNNLLVAGIPDLSHLPPGTRLLFPADAALVVEGQNFPCKGPAAILQAQYPQVPNLYAAFLREAMQLRGIVAWVERPGRICAGDTLRVLFREVTPYTYPG